MSVAWLAIALAAISVEGDTGCPRPDELQALLTEVKSAPHRAVMQRRGERGLELTLLDERGVRIAARQLEAATCEGLLRAAAATVLAWEAMLPPPTPAAPEPRAPLLVPSSPPTPDIPAPSPVFWRLEVGLAGVLAGGAPTGGIAGAFLVGPRGVPWRARVHLSQVLPVETAAATGTVGWVRSALGLGLSLRVLERALALEAAAGVEAAVLGAWGRGFEQNFTSAVFDPAAETSLRVSRAVSARVELFVQVALTLPFIQQTLRVTGVNVNVLLPPVTGSVRLGVSFGG